MNLNRREMLQTSLAFMAAASVPVVTTSVAVPKIVTTGLPTIDAAIGGGLQRGEFYLVVGKKGTGKTSLLQEFQFLNPKADIKCHELSDMAKLAYPDSNYAFPRIPSMRSMFAAGMARYYAYSARCNDSIMVASSGSASLGSQFYATVVFALTKSEDGHSTSLTIVKNRYHNQYASVRLQFTINGIRELS